ncbi:UDP-N-acetylmuramate dehydrogenase [uncultured Psychrobacter sp.]|uniref:UDP-N-acetylmuramate dehydrogenase n=1 Tax=uncultured Psychrobacter sp. TaxID=259303 RepID=UPI002621D6CB|nr:UDP-N-acetylmuramate dehydrogenase [uncultured Psychrobacter sp.]
MNTLYQKKINEIFPEIIEFEVSLSKLSQWKVGGKADIIIRPRSKNELIKVRQWLYLNGIKSLIIGSTTNLLFSDEDIHIVIIQIGTNFSKVAVDGLDIVAEPGIWVPSLARLAMQKSLSGIEHTCGIPGTLGGLVVMNGGSQRKGIGSVVTYVETIDNQGNIKRYDNSQCNFSYRQSIFQNIDEVVVEVGLKLNNGRAKCDIRQDMLDILHSRRKKFPRKQPNCGSVFVSNPDMYEDYGPPGQIIEELGLKGMNQGGAQISEQHANFIVNNGSAQSKDILYLINTVKETVYKETGYKMVVEARFVTSNGEITSI